MRQLLGWNGSQPLRNSLRRKPSRQASQARLSIEHLEDRRVLSISPTLTVIPDQSNLLEGDTLHIAGSFTDEIEGDGSSGGGTIGLDPNAFASLGLFDTTDTAKYASITSIVINSGLHGNSLSTPQLVVSYVDSSSQSHTDVYQGVIYTDPDFSWEIAVFAFDDFNLRAGATITADADTLTDAKRPVALLSQDDLVIAGTIDVSAWTNSTSLSLGLNIPGPGGGAGGHASGTFADRHGDPAAGAPLLAGGQLGSVSGVSGSGGGFGGSGGRGETETAAVGTGGIASANLELAIQGGSGGSASGVGTILGGGGGGGIELGAVDTITITTTGQVLANGGWGGRPGSSSSATGAGGGAGGGILVHGNHVVQAGLLSAKGGQGGFRNIVGGAAGGGGGGGEIMLVRGASGTMSTDLTKLDVSGGAAGDVADFAEPGQPGNVHLEVQGSTASPVNETFDYFIDWGDDSTTGPLTIDPADGNIGDPVSGSFNHSHNYSDDGVFTVTVTITGSGGGSDVETFNVTVANVDPTVMAATFSITENAPNGTIVGTVTATDPGDDTLTFSIAGGTGAAAFAINASTGEITVADSALLDFENSPTLTLNVDVSDEDGGLGSASITIDILNQASIHGVVFVDTNGNGQFNGNEAGIDGVLVELHDEFGNPVLDSDNIAITAVTSAGGYYLFEDLDPGTYQIFEQQPSGFDDGAEYLGTLGGTIVENDRMEVTLARTDAFDYAFTELGQQLTASDAPSAAFWQAKKGQQLIRDGGVPLATWLTASFPNVFGNTFEGGYDGDVADFFRDQLFKQKGKKSAGSAKVDAEFMAVALATYFTSGTLAGNVAVSYGFTVTETGIGTKVVNVGTNGAAFNVANGSQLTVMQLLLATDSLTDKSNAEEGYARLYDANGDGTIDNTEASLRIMAFEVYHTINGSGNI